LVVGLKGILMKFGINLFATDFGIHPAELGQTLETLGFESLFFAEHTHIPVNRRSPHPYAADINQDYLRCLDPFVALATVAASTNHLRIGTGICLVVERDPITVAKAVATLDHLSGGRFLFGVGGGWNLEEMENHGTDPQRRWKVLRERIEAMKTIWMQDEPAYHGEFVSFGPIWQWPKPAQKPHPPILIGGDGANTLKRVVRYGDGWMPVAAYDPNDLTAFKQRVANLNQLAADAGRDPIPVTVMGMPPKLDVLKRYEQIGVERILFWLDSASKDEIIPILEQYADLIQYFV
jgi:probable F420-dependent oxidoreductase